MKIRRDLGESGPIGGPNYARENLFIALGLCALLLIPMGHRITNRAYQIFPVRPALQPTKQACMTSPCTRR